MLEPFSEKISGFNWRGSVIVLGKFQHSFKRNLRNIKVCIQSSSLWRPRTRQWVAYFTLYCVLYCTLSMYIFSSLP